MAAFRPISFEPKEVLTKPKLDQMAANDQYLFENTANMMLKSSGGVVVRTSLKLIAGAVVLGPGSNEHGAINVSYAGEFNSNTTPIVTTGLVVTHTEDHFSTLTIRGRGSTQPTDSGFQFRWETNKRDAKKRKRFGSVVCNYMALGVQTRVTAAPE